MSTIQAKIPADTWIRATWDEYIQATENPDYEKAKFYYNNGRLRIEMSPLGHDHACDHSIINYAINLYATLKNIDLTCLDNCTYHKTGYQSAQPDLSYYIGKQANVVPFGTNIIQLDRYPSPALVIEIANTSLADDKGEKRLLYESLEIAEYWIVDVKKMQIIAFTIDKKESKRIKRSNVLPNLETALLESALRRTRKSSHSKVGAWLLERFQEI
ncbi:MAG: Uma2 family endonuclease [Spirulina sp.]